MRESGIQAAETITAGGAAGAAAASQSFAESRTFNALRGGEDWLENVNNFIPRRKYICLIVKYIADFDFAISLYIYIFMFSCIHTYIHFFVCSYMYV